MQPSHNLRFSQYPGAYERHLLRRAGNPLFPSARRQVIQMEVHQAQRRDSEDVAAFLSQFQSLMERAVALKPQEDSEVVLKLKEDLDKAYERCCGLAGDQSKVKDALKKLLQLVMQAVWRGAEADPAAQSNLREEEIARATHFQLLEHALIADLLRSDSPIDPEELAATLLSETDSVFAAALNLFDADQLALLASSAQTLVDNLASDIPQYRAARGRLMQLQAHLDALTRENGMAPDTVR